MLSWLSVAIALLPDIVKAFGDGTANEVTDTVVKAVKDATGATTPKQAQAKIDANDEVATQLKVQLAQIAADAAEKKRQADLATLQAQLADQDSERKQQLETLKASVADLAGARATFADLAKSGSSFAWGAPVISVVVTVGFFFILHKLMTDESHPSGDERLQVLNVILGTLATAFTAVVSFWVGSSDGSRKKDVASFQLQAQQAQQTHDTIQAQNRTTLEVIKKAGAASGGEAGTATSDKPNNFDACVSVILQWEGGYGNDPKDPGGATNFGIIKTELEAWRGHPVSIDDVKKLSKEEAVEIYRTNYWNKMKCDELPLGVDLVVFDFGVNAGPSRSVKLLQKIVGAEQDGSVGPATVGATGNQDAATVVNAMSQGRLEYYRGLTKLWDRFGKGWTNRTNDVNQRALQMIKA